MKKNKYVVVNSDKRFSVARVPTRVDPIYETSAEYKTLLDKNRARLREHQTMLYANHARPVLIVFQGMDTAGKDGAISHIISGLNPQGCTVISFKAPSPAELDHDFLWRVNCVLPTRGQMGIFNRSYYEEVLITRVHPELIKRERLPGGGEHGKKFWDFRYHDIVNHEKYLHRQGYEIVKIFIHISKDEQKIRLLERFNNPKKHWKISEGDVRERAFWKQYQSAYEECIAETASKSCPWYIVPGDDKEHARLMISQILVDRFETMKLHYPHLNAKEKIQLKKLKAELDRETK
jgi:PPK2 family polyphosphate:nucleotide phosphotransferase